MTVLRPDEFPKGTLIAAIASGMGWVLILGLVCLVLLFADMIQRHLRGK